LAIVLQPPFGNYCKDSNHALQILQRERQNVNIYPKSNHGEVFILEKKNKMNSFSSLIAELYYRFRKLILKTL